MHPRSWDRELWTYMKAGDGVTCPIFSTCNVRLEGGWCPNQSDGTFGKHLYLCGDLEDTSPILSGYDMLNHWHPGKVFKLVETLAQDYLRHAGVFGPPTLEDTLINNNKQYKIEVRPLPLKACYGAVWHLGDTWVLHVNRNHPPAVKRFTIFHELFHILVHGECTPKFKKRGSTEAMFNELLADYFAMCLMAPRDWLEQQWLELHNVSALANRLQMPRAPLAVRLIQAKLL